MRLPVPSGELSERLSNIANLSRAELLDHWEKDWDREPSKYVSRRLLEYSAAWHLQCRELDEPDREVKRLLRGSAAGRQAIKPGTRLVREWNGRTYHVEVLSKGFRWNDKQYRSLSVIAREITGAHWSGPRFFGL